MIDLWPDDLEPSKVRAPASILKEQGTMLADKTGHQLVGELRARATGGFRYTFCIRAPSLSYAYELFVITHEVTLYPVTIHLDGVLCQEVFPESDGSVQADNEEAFIEVIRKIFGAARTRDIISSLLAQVKA